MCNDVEEFDDTEDEHDPASDPMFIHAFLFTVELVDAENLVAKRIIDSYYYVGCETDFFEEAMGVEIAKKWRNRVENALHGMFLRATINGQRNSKLFSLKVNIDQDDMRKLMEVNPDYVYELCTKYGVKLG